MALIKRNTAYSVNDIVNTKYGTKLKCTTAGTTSTNPLILDGTSPITDGTVVWEVQEESGGTGQGLVDYEINKNYNVGDIVIYDDKIYKCITAHTSTSTFDNTKWEEISGGADLPEWQANTSYTAGKYLVHEGTVYRVTTSFTSGVTFSNTNLSAYIAPIMIGATSSASGNSGLIPLPTTSDITKFLCGDGTWKSAGGSGLNVIDDTLWSGTFNSVVAGDSLTLQNDYADYDEIILYVGGQYSRSFITSLGTGMGYDNDGGNLGVTYSYHVIITFSGNSGNAVIWQYGTGEASAEVSLVGRKYININNYSTTEQEIGTWIDGKKLYQKTLTGNLPSTTTPTPVLDLGTLYNVDSVTDISGYIVYTESGSDGYWMINSGTEQTAQMRISTTKNLLITCTSASKGLPFYITIKYTKV